MFRFFYTKNQSPALLFLLFRKRSHSRRLFGCKRLHNAFGSLPTFCELRFRRNLSLNGSLRPRRSKLYIACSDFLCKNQSSLMPLLLLFRKKARSAQLLTCKRVRNVSLSLPPFCEESDFGASLYLKGSHHQHWSKQYRSLLCFFMQKIKAHLICCSFFTFVITKGIKRAVLYFSLKSIIVCTLGFAAIFSAYQRVFETINFILQFSFSAFYTLFLTKGGRAESVKRTLLRGRTWQGRYRAFF